MNQLSKTALRKMKETLAMSGSGVLPVALRMRRTQFGLSITIGIVLLALAGTFIAPFEPTAFVGLPFSQPTEFNLLGTDGLGRDVLSRFLSGGFTLLLIASLATVIGIVLGTIIGLAAGYSKTWRGDVMVQGLDVFLAFPQIVLVLLFLSLIGPKAWLIVVLVGAAHGPRVARVVRAATLEVAERDFVKAAEANGVPISKLLFREILPNITGVLMVESGLRLTISISIVAALSFLGFGLQPPSPDWGLMINENRGGLTLQPWGVVAPVIAIGLLTIGTNLIADGFARALGHIDSDNR